MNKIIRLSLVLAITCGLFLLLGGCTTNSEPTTQSSSTITEKEAIAIASDLLPPDAVTRARVVSILRQELEPHGTWQVEFLSANVTREELGWQEDVRTKFVGSDEVLQNVIISIDAKTGEILSRTAGTTVLLGGPVPSETPISPTISEPAGSWQIGEHFYYGQDCIWGDTLVGLEYEYVEGKKIGQYLTTFDLSSAKQKRVLEIPEDRMAGTPSIYQNKIVWDSVDRDEFFAYAIKSSLPPPPNYDVFLLDLDTGEVTQLTTEEHAQRSPRIYGNTVVWLDARIPQLEQYPLPFDVYAYDLKTGQETRITANTTVESYNQVAIDGSIIVWTDMRHADIDVASHAGNDSVYNNEIYAYDLNTGEERRLTTSPRNDQSPDISGKTVTWLRQEDFRKADIFSYDLASGLETQVSNSGYAAFSPSIYEKMIAWTDARSSDGNTTNDVVINGQGPSADIYLYDLETGTETRLTPTEEWKVWQSPVIYGDHMVYEWSRQTGALVYVMNLP